MVTKRKEPQKPQAHRPCSVPGCREHGEFRAPVSRFDIGKYQFLCLEHIREFNKAWDYFDGWSRGEIETFMHDAAFGHRPTWKMGSAGPVFTSDKLREAFFTMLGEKPRADSRPRPSIPRKERDALAVLSLEPGAGPALIKSQYKKLVKKYHPDVNRGDRQSEETFKRITAAYTLLNGIYGKQDEDEKR